MTLPVAAGELPPQTRVRLSVIQWMPLEGAYQRWDALGGELVVSEENTILLPVVGALSVRDKSPEQVAAEVAGVLQARLGLVDPPNTSIEIVEYPPVYVVGSVEQPGAFPFRPGMTVLQAFALGGGELRAEQGENHSANRVRLISELRTTEAGMLRAQARIARLQAEFSGAEAIVFPDDVTDHSDRALVQEVVGQERAVFAARANGLTREAESLEELSILLNSEIQGLQERITDVDKTIASAEKELEGVQELVESGMATVSRRSEIERALVNLRFDRLTQMTAILRAQQGLSQAKREAARLHDVRQTEVAQDLQVEQAKLEQFSRDHATAQRLLLQLDLDDPGLMAATQAPELIYSIIRATEQGTAEVEANETTAMQPGDVLKVSRAVPDPAVPSVAQAQATPSGG